VELCFTALLTKHTQRVFTTGNPVNDFFRNERHASSNLFTRAGDKTRSAEIFVGLLRLRGKCFIRRS
jgi:hypothetical protein